MTEDGTALLIQFLFALALVLGFLWFTDSHREDCEKRGGQMPCPTCNCIFIPVSGAGKR